jgi:POT family proton-dependent oligopeptide transporter
MFSSLPIFFGTLTAFYTSLTLIALGTGLLKPNMTTMIGHLYEKDDPRMTAGVNIVYSGINIGAMVAPLVCGFLAQSQVFKNWLQNHGFNPLHSWHWGFGAAGVGMVFGLLQYWLHKDRLSAYGDRPQPRHSGLSAEDDEPAGLTSQEWHKLAALGFLFIAFTLFIAISEQAGSSLALFADKCVNRTIAGFEWPASWAQSINPLFVILLTPLFAWLWPFLAQRHREPSSPMKFALGLAFVAAGTAFMVPAALGAGSGLVSAWWLVVVFLLQTVGELLTSPVGLATANRLAPARYASLTMGVWFLSIAAGSMIAGKLAGFCDSERPADMALIFGGMAVVSALAAAALWRLTPAVKRLMSDEPQAVKAGAQA